MIDGTDIARIRIVKSLLENLDKELEKPVPVSIFVNKMDLENDTMTINEVKDMLDLDKLESDYIWKIM